MKPIKIVKVEEGALKNRIFRFRYRVFCEEIGMLAPENYPTCQEYDQYDKFAEQYAILEEGGELVGCFRFIVANPLGFPGLDHLEMNRMLSHYPIETVGEISRVALAAKYRNLPMAIELIRTIARYGRPYLEKMGIRYVFCAVEERLYRLMVMAGVPFVKAGKSGEYFGKKRSIALLEVDRLSLPAVQSPRPRAFLK